MVQPGLEEVASDEITREVGGQIKKTGRGFVAFRVPEITADLLNLRTTEDVFVLAWGTDDLTSRPTKDLDRIHNWTRRAPWDQLLKIHHGLRPKPKGRPTYRLVTQMSGKHGYHRFDAGKMLAQGLDGVFPASWKPAEENAAVEIWLTISGQQAVCGLRLSDRTMRHRTYKTEHLPASLRPTVAASMVRLAGTGQEHVVVDPMCGVGTIMAEQIELAQRRRATSMVVMGGDLDANALRAAAANLKRYRPTLLARWDARRLPFESESVDRVISNPPFGRQLGEPQEIAKLYRDVLLEYQRILRPGGRVVMLVGDATPLLNAVDPLGWATQKQVRIRLLGLPAFIGVWRKPEG